MNFALRIVASLLLVLSVGATGWAQGSTTEYLHWLDARRQLWVVEMKRMEAHEHGQYRQDYHRLSERINEVGDHARTLRQARGEKELKLRDELVRKVSEVEQGLEFLLSEVPELAVP